jgi:hypothetical protein
MTIAMSLEIESGVSIEEISLVLSEVGAEVRVNSGDVSGNLKLSNAYFVFLRCDGLNEVVAEGVRVSWSVGVRGAFHCPVGSLAESAEDIKRFLTAFSEKKRYGFVFSFQYESVYAIRDKDGLRFLKEMVS